MASEYPGTPNPTTMPRATGEITEWCRNSSRACTFEMCSSITGTCAASMASRIAYE